jgi:uncharacterized protein (DUF1501 family)
VGERAPATVVLDPAQFSLRVPKGADPRTVTDAFLATAAPLDPEPTRAAAQRAIPASVTAVDALARAASATPAPAADDDQDGGKITELLATAAGLVTLGLGTRVIVIAGDGFDTHTDQAARHGRLLADLATGVRRFTEAVAAQGAAERVMVMTTSEFGRRVKENGSGTDHGTGSVQLLAGPGLTRSQIVGEAELGALANGDLPAAIDSRCLYAAALDWLGGDRAVTDHVLAGSYDRHGLVRP